MKSPVHRHPAPPPRLALVVAISLVVSILGKLSPAGADPDAVVVVPNAIIPAGGAGAGEGTATAVVVPVDDANAPETNADSSSPPPTLPSSSCASPIAPPEHRNGSCDRIAQNARRLAEHVRTEKLSRDERTPDAVYLAMPEERTYICPPPEDDVDVNMRSLGRERLGHATNWVVYNRSKGPVVIHRVNEDGNEVPANNYIKESGGGIAKAEPSTTATAVWPVGPILQPGAYAIVEGRQGHAFVVREYDELLLPNFVVGHLPRTISFPPSTVVREEDEEIGGGERLAARRWTRYVSNDGTLHISGRVGNVLMRHRMGNIYVRNMYDVPCPLALQQDVPKNAGRNGPPKDFDPSCNVMDKAFINKVGCPIDIYFSPRAWEGYDEEVEIGGPRTSSPGSPRQCEIFTRHLGPIGPFLQTKAYWDDPTVRALDDGWLSPLIFQNTYNRHSFVARMSHDKSLVARIDLDHDEVVDCPEPRRRAFDGYGEGAEEEREAMVLGEALADALFSYANTTKFSLLRAALDCDVPASSSSVDRKLVDAKVGSNATASRLFLGGGSRDLNHVGIISSSMLVA